MDIDGIEKFKSGCCIPQTKIKDFDTFFSLYSYFKLYTNNLYVISKYIYSIKTSNWISRYTSHVLIINIIDYFYEIETNNNGIEMQK